ncbi:hypothetical protein O9K51_10907 [Purpureocillium lavendulum]|uniref:Uncharacterized protein n=1 Tax=Purpureocillium lavendulum TaxID=1247861 RepID=A0AB34FDR0_9HYPO|nr:hypothetical protein O9K51_10907 [Purpureocillium lavendulum]
MSIRSFWRLNREIREASSDPDDAWRAAAQRVAQELRAYSAAPQAPALPPALAAPSYGDGVERTYKERKILALETIAEAARLWIILDEIADALKDYGSVARDEVAYLDTDDDLLCAATGTDSFLTRVELFLERVMIWGWECVGRVSIPAI